MREMTSCMHVPMNVISLTYVQPIAKLTQEERHEGKRHFISDGMAREHGGGSSSHLFCLDRVDGVSSSLATAATRHKSSSKYVISLSSVIG